MWAPFLVVALAAPVACVFSGQEGRGVTTTAVTPDPEATALPEAPRGKMLDPLAPAPPPPPAPAPTPEPSAAASASAATSAVASGPRPATSASAAPKPSAAAAAPVECGTKDKPCPMQLFMRGTMSGATTPEQLAAAFARVAGMSPNGGWSWRAIANKGAEAAKAGDVPAAKAQCKACHDAYKEPYKQQYRARKI
jgi:hypothetical protein